MKFLERYWVPLGLYAYSVVGAIANDDSVLWGLTVATLVMGWFWFIQEVTNEV